MIEKPIIFFDADCAMCHWAVRFTHKRDKKNTFLYAPLKGETAQKYLQEWFLQHPDVDSIVLLNKDVTTCYYSKAVFSILWQLGFPWSILGVLHFLPKWLLFPADSVYRLVAKHRSKSCAIRNHTPKSDEFLP